MPHSWAPGMELSSQPDHSDLRRQAQQAVEDVEAWRSQELPPQQLHADTTGSLRVCLLKRPCTEREKALLGTAGERGACNNPRHADLSWCRAISGRWLAFSCSSRAGELHFDAISVSNPFVYHHERATNGPKGRSRLTKGRIATRRVGPFDHSHGAHDNTDAVYRAALRDLPAFVAGGGTATCIAYGQTGAGKTFTCTRIQDRLATEMFSAAAAFGGQTVRLGFFENQGDRCFDLQNDRARLHLREDATGTINVVGLTETIVSSPDALRAALAKGNALRASAPTQTHPCSSRSHAILTLRLSRTSPPASSSSASSPSIAAGTEPTFPIDPLNADAESKDDSGYGLLPSTTGGMEEGPSGGLLRVVDLAGSERHESSSSHSMARILEVPNSLCDPSAWEN